MSEVKELVSDENVYVRGGGNTSAIDSWSAQHSGHKVGLLVFNVLLIDVLKELFHPGVFVHFVIENFMNTF